jgi:hypothetical protein
VMFLTGNDLTYEQLNLKHSFINQSCVWIIGHLLCTDMTDCQRRSLICSNHGNFKILYIEWVGARIAQSL